MNLIPSRLHGVLDYAVGALLIAAPWLFGFNTNAAATAVPLVLGAGAIVYSLITDYELGLYPVMPLKVHLGLDAASGFVLLASPWVLGFHNYILWPHVTFGLLEIVVAALTVRHPTVSRAALPHPAL